MSNANESAFPQVETVTAYTDNGRGDLYPNTYSTGGLTKREYFAAMAMQGLIQHMNPVCSGNQRKRAIRDVVKDSTDIADALLAELERTA